MLRRSPCLAAALIFSLAAPSHASEPHVAFELVPGAFLGAPLYARFVFSGPTSEAAASFVRNCPGYAIDERAGAEFFVPREIGNVTIAAAGEGLAALLVETPDGLFQCARLGDNGIAVIQLGALAPGRYRLLPTGASAQALEGRVIIADRPTSPVELLGFDVARLGPPRFGRHLVLPHESRQVLAEGAAVVGETAFAPVDPAAFCPGYGRLDAADVVVSLAEPAARLSFYALSEMDLTLAVTLPDGRWLCNDDSFGLNPAVTAEPAPQGDYLIFVGTFAERAEATFTLFAGAGYPLWSEGGEPAGPPRLGSTVFQPEPGQNWQLLARGPVRAEHPFSELSIPDFCPGYTGAEGPDLVVTLPRQHAQPLSFYALSGADTVLAVQGPDGTWLCDDDSFMANPGVTFPQAIAGEYRVWVGGFEAGTVGAFALFAALSEPNWSQAAQAALAAETEPAVGRVGFTVASTDLRIILDLRP